MALAHGAGAPMDHPFMDAVVAHLSEAIGVMRFEFPYMSKRRLDGKRRGPDGQAVLEESFFEAAERCASICGSMDDVILAGKSMGGRYATRVVDRVGARGCAVFGYPFHPPGRPEKLRTEHLETLKTPTVIVQGARDPFGTESEVASYKLSPQISVRFLSDGDHSLKPRKSSGFTHEAHLEAAAGHVLDLLE